MFKNRRTTLLAALVAALALSALVFATGAGAQREGAAGQANTSTRSGQQKRVFVGRGSETRQGSRVTITADDSLKDYSAYRSGDRFYVVLPKSAAGAAARGASGKGYSDMQVQQRGDSVVLSYRVQPGAKPRVEQKFNRLDVVFDVPEGGGQQQQQQNTAPAEAGRNQQQAEANRNQTSAAQQASQATATQPNTNPNAAAERAAAERAAEAARAQQVANNAANAATTTTPQVSTAGPPAPVADPNAQPGVTPATALAQESTTPVNPSAEQQLAQAQPPASTAPVSITKPATAAAPTGTSLGAFLMRNWAMMLIIGLVVVGLGLVIASRRTPAATREPAEGADKDVAADEPRAARVKESAAAALKEASVAAASSVPSKASVKSKPSVPAEASVKPEAPVPAEASVTPEASVPAEASAPAEASVKADAASTQGAAEASADFDVKPLAAAALLAGGAALAKPRKLSRKEARQEAKRKKKGARADSPAAEEPQTVSPVEPELVAEESVAEETLAAETGTVEAVVQEPVVEESVVEETAAAETVAEEPVTEAAAEPAVAEAAVEERAVETEAAPPLMDIEPFAQETSEPEVVEPEASEPEASEPEAPSAVAEIEPAFAPDPERVQAETRTLLEGGAYDRSVISTRDAVARQMIAAELLSALAGRNPQRRERAGTVFVEQGYFDETARDLREADAPAERAAAARSLALLGDRVATPHLIAALEDQNLDVRRAAVEALGSLRDPAAVEPLEILLERERNERNRIPPRVIRNAVETCREAAYDVVAAPPAPPFEPASESAPVSEAAAEPEAVADPEVVAEPEAARPAEVASHEAAEESAHSIAPFVGEAEQEHALAAGPVAEADAETSHAVEPVAAVDARADEEETTLVAEAPAPKQEFDTFVADLTDELNAVADAQNLETAVAEPQAVTGTDLQPFVETDEYAVEVSEPAAAQAAEEVALEPFRETGAESAQATLFDVDEGAAEETTREIAPLHTAATAEPAAQPSADKAAGEWFDFDMQELREKPSAAAEEPPAAAPQAPAENVFETSSGETLSSHAESDAGTDAKAVTPEPSYVADAETFESHAPEREVAAPASSAEKGVAPFDEFSTVPASIQQRLSSSDPEERAAAIVELSRVDTDEAFHQICAGFDDDSKEVRGAAARALFGLRADRAESFTRALREATPERRRQIGAALSSSGLAGEAISQLTGESREKTYEAFSLLFLMAKAGEVAPLVRAIEGHPNNEVRLAVVKLLALSGQKEILPAFRRLAVRGSLPTEVRSAVMEAIYQISSSQPTHA